LKTLIDQTEIHAEDIRLIKRLRKRESEQEFPEPMKWALQLVYFDGSRWVEICRIDNYPHCGKIGAHVHEYGKKSARPKALDFNEAEREIKIIGARILMEKFQRR
jgi:hypothetical protein